MKKASQLHWDYFLLLEKDLAAISETVELSERNYATYGPRILQLILNAGGELDAALKSFAKAVDSQHEAAKNSQPNMTDYKGFITAHALEQFATAQVRFLHSDIVMVPWVSLATNPDDSISWWKAYNNIKHKRAEYYEEATLEVALELTAALFVVDVYLAEATLEPNNGSTRIIDWESHKMMPQLEEYYAAK